MSEGSLEAKIRKRIEFEDELLNSRTTIFLGINGLWAAAVGISNAVHLQIGIAVLGTLVSTMWVMCSWKSWRVISALTRNYLHLLKNTNRPDAKVEKIVQKALGNPGRRPTDILARWLPILFLCVWVIFLGWLVWSSF